MELAANPRAALLFHWDPLGRQVRIEGPVERLSAEESAAYVRSRPRGSQLSALASPQSRPVADRGQLERRVAELAARYEGAELPVPDFWGGFRLLPEWFEFWQHREDRLHDRLAYRARGRRLADRAAGAVAEAPRASRGSPDRRRGERRLVVVIGAVVFVDTMFYAAIAPLLPGLAHSLHLSKLSAGVMTASYPAGTLVAAIPKRPARGPLSGRSGRSTSDSRCSPARRLRSRC